jgi:hypothetical protein
MNVGKKKKGVELSIILTWPEAILYLQKCEKYS